MMYADHVLDGTNSEDIQPEVLAWLQVVHKLRPLVPKLAVDQRRSSLKLIAESIEALQVCASKKRVGKTNPAVQKARRLVKALLSLFPDWQNFVDWTFFISYSNVALGAIVHEVQELSPQVSEEERRALLQDTDSVLKEFRTVLEEGRRELGKGPWNDGLKRTRGRNRSASPPRNEGGNLEGKGRDKGKGKRKEGS
jgi:hypothetical protein